MLLLCGFPYFKPYTCYTFDIEHQVWTEVPVESAAIFDRTRSYVHHVSSCWLEHEKQVCFA
jgi:hypothetical protein